VNISLTEGGNRKRRSGKKITETSRLILFSNIFIFFISLKARKREKNKRLILLELFFYAVTFPLASQLFSTVRHIFKKEK